MHTDNNPTPPEDSKAQTSKEIDLDDDLDDEPLGERQEEACSLEEGCQSCQ